MNISDKRSEQNKAAGYNHKIMDRLRIISMLLGSLPFFVVFYELSVPLWHWLWLIVCCFIWPTFAYFYVNKSALPRAAERKSLLIDCFLVSSLFPLSYFNLLLTFMFLLVLITDRMQSGAYHLWRYAILYSILGMVCFGLLTGFKTHLHTSVMVMLAFFPIMFLHTFTVSWSNRSLIILTRQKNAQLHELSMTDALTKLYNIRYWHDHAPQILLNNREQKQDLTLMLIDCDNFKLINDTCGHQTGDAVLRQTGRALLEAQAQHQGSIAARLGGDEFALLLFCDLATAELLAQRLKREIAAFGASYELERPFSVCIGLASYHHHESFSQFFNRADRALYQAKNSGKNAIQKAQLSV